MTYHHFYTNNMTQGIPSRVALLFALIWMGLASCQHQAGEKPLAQNAPEKAPAQIMLSAAQVQTAGIRWDIPAQKRDPGYLSVSGELRVHPEYIATISAYSDGIVSELFTGINKKVNKGERIAVIRKAELLDLQQEYLETKDGLRYLQQEYERYASLGSDNATAGKNLQKAESEWRAAQTRLQVLAAKLRLYQIDPDKLRPDNVQSQINLYAPFSGIITHTMVSLGSAVQSGSPVCEIIDLDKMHADLFLFEKDWPFVHNGQTVYLETGAPGMPPLRAQIFSIDPSLDPDRKALRAHAKLVALPPGVNLINGAFLQARIETRAENSLPAIPSDCVLKEAEGFYVYALERNDKDRYFFQKLAVQPGGEIDGLTLVRPITAWPAETRIVLKGAYYVAAQGAEIEVE